MLRKEQGLSQTQLGQLTGTSFGQISMIEREATGSSLHTATAIAGALGTSLAYLLGQIDDRRPAREIASQLTAKAAQIRKLEENRAERLDPNGRERMSIGQFDRTVGTDVTVRDDTITCELKFPRAWLREQGFRAHMCRIVRMTGEAMEPTIPDGSAILVDTAATERRDGCIAVVRLGDRQVVKRLLDDAEAGWLLASDNPDKAAWPTKPWPDGATVIGEVKWLGRALV